MIKSKTNSKDIKKYQKERFIASGPSPLQQQL